MDRRVLIIAGLILIIGLGVIGYQQISAGPIYKGQVVEPPQAAPAFTLQSADGPVSLADFSGKTVLIYFGYSFCPDVCPTTLGDLKKVYTQLGEQSDRVQVIFVSVDPRRDTPGRMGEYAHFFHPEFLGLSGSMDDITTVTEAYNIHFHYNDAQSQTNYTVDHTSIVLVIDGEGNERLIWQHGTSVEDMVSDLKKLLAS